jgi:hypothetical protein
MNFLEKVFSTKDPLLVKIKMVIEKFPYSNRYFRPGDLLFQSNSNSILPIFRFLQNKWLNFQVLLEKFLSSSFLKELSEETNDSLNKIVKIIGSKPN